MASSEQNVNYFILYGNSDICGCLSLFTCCVVHIWFFGMSHSAKKSERTLSVIAKLHGQRAQVLENYRMILHSCCVRARECHKIPNMMDKTNNKSSVIREATTKQRTRNKCTKFDGSTWWNFFAKRWSQNRSIKAIYLWKLFAISLRMLYELP